MSVALSLLLAALAAPPLLAASGGPDDFGYVYVDSDEAEGPTFDWIDISASGTATGISSDGEAEIPLPFTFWFYGDPYSSVTVGEGLLLLGLDTGISGRNQCFPANNRSGDDSLIMGLWDDLDSEAEGAGDVYWEVLGKAPARQLVVQFEQLPPDDGDGFFSFEIILEETSNRILLQYASVEEGDVVFAGGASATVGIQPDGTEGDDGLEYACNSAALHDGLAIAFDAVCEDLDGDGLGACDGDCDDEDPAVGPNASEQDDGLDNDCDGLADEDYVAAGDLVINEFLCDPQAVQDRAGEWFELYNASERIIDIVGWVLQDSGASVVVDSSTPIGPGGYALLAVEGNAAFNGGLPQADWVFDYDEVHLDNGGDSLSIRMGSTEIDSITYDPALWPVQSGISVYLDPGYANAEANDSPHPWCQTPLEPVYAYGEKPYGFGTPGQPNPADLCCFDEDGDGHSTCDGDCDDQDPARFPGNPEVRDLLDNDCSGMADEEWVAAGDIIVSELMDDPTTVQAEAGEWFELLNVGPYDLNLLGWQVTDEREEGFFIDQDVIVPVGSYAILAVQSDAALNGNLPWTDYVYAYADFPLRSYDDDQIILKMGELEVDRMGWSNVSPWDNAAGQSSFLDPDDLDAVSNDSVDSWCLVPADKAYDYGGAGSGDYGTPGAANPSIDDDGDGHSACGDCDDQDPAIHPAATEICDDGLDNDCDEAVDQEDADCGAQDTADSPPPGDSVPEGDTGGPVHIQEDCVGCAAPAGGGLLAVVLGLLGAALRRRVS